MTDFYRIDHPLIYEPSLQEVARYGEINGMDQAAALNELTRLTKQPILDEERDPLRYGWEPPIWKIVDALMGFACFDQTFLKVLKDDYNMTWEQFAEEVRQRLGFDRVIRMLLILGGNRGGKSQYTAKRGVQNLSFLPGYSVMWMHMQRSRSINEQQKLVFQHLPPEFKGDRKGKKAWLRYNEHNGFSDGKFSLTNESEAQFVNYSQKLDEVIQGIQKKLILPDELLPADWQHEFGMRLASEGGQEILCFTPVQGYTPCVKLWMDGHEVTMQRPCFLLPKDGGPPLPHLALGLDQPEYEELLRLTAAEEKKDPRERRRWPGRPPQSRPEDCLKWLNGHHGGPPIPKGRQFEMMPRVAKCVDPRKAVIWFWSDDNPYGDPKEVIAECLQP